MALLAPGMTYPVAALADCPENLQPGMAVRVVEEDVLPPCPPVR